MKKTRTAVTVAASCLAGLLAGCMVMSIAPYYHEQDLVFEPGLLGAWSKVPDASEHWRFEADQAKAYQLTYADSGKTNVMQAHLFKLEGSLFLDLYAPDPKCDVLPPPVPSHLLLRVLSLSPNVKLVALDHGWLMVELQKNPKAVRHEIPVTNDKPEDRPIILTGNTGELQAFLAKHLKTTEAWKEPFELRKD